MKVGKDGKEMGSTEAFWYTSRSINFRQNTGYSEHSFYLIHIFSAKWYNNCSGRMEWRDKKSYRKIRIINKTFKTKT